jgi:hypothetical protein
MRALASACQYRAEGLGGPQPLHLVWRLDAKSTTADAQNIERQLGKRSRFAVDVQHLGLRFNEARRFLDDVKSEAH